MTPDNDLAENLRKLGLRLEEDQESRGLSLLRAILRIQSNPPIPLTFSQIYDAYVLSDPDKEFTKAWVHRVLKTLVDQGFVRLESPTAHRKRYTSDVNSIMTALEKLRLEAMDEIEKKRVEIEQQHNAIRTMDAGGMAQELVEYLSGQKQLLQSRSIRGLDEWHRITQSTIYDKAQPGDIIRTSVVEFGPFLSGVEDRMGRMFRIAAKGVEIRYMIPFDTFHREEEFTTTVPTDFMRKALELLAVYVKKGLKFDIRVNPSKERSLAFASLNDETLAFWVSENPMMGAWMTRNFNPQLIDNAIRNFEESWENSISLIGLTPDALEALGGSDESMLLKLLKRGEKIAELDDSDEITEPDI